MKSHGGVRVRTPPLLFWARASFRFDFAAPDEWWGADGWLLSRTEKDVGRGSMSCWSGARSQWDRRLTGGKGPKLCGPGIEGSRPQGHAGMGQDAAKQQQEYYSASADQYDAQHCGADPEHDIAAILLWGAVDHLEATSLLDVGAGTGRTLLAAKKSKPSLLVRGIEPVAELRNVGYRKGLTPQELTAGDGTSLELPDNSFDIVSAFAVLHHVPRPEIVVAEMLRVARRAVFISDANNFGQGGVVTRTVKVALRGLGLWRAFDWIKTAGKGYTVSDGDGVAYSYSILNTAAQLRRTCRSVHLMNTSPAGNNLLTTATHAALLALK